MRTTVVPCLGVAAFAVALLVPTPGPSAHEAAPSEPAAAPAPSLETLLSKDLDGVDGTEVIVSRVTVPPNTALPKHWHPGEEFAYVLEGSVVLWLDGAGETLARAGDVLVVPLKQVHTAITKDEGATILVFRVHESGKPERVLVE